MRAKVPEIVKLIEHRLEVGDYVSQRLPSERTLAAELGVSHMTARKAVQEIKRKGAIPGRAGRRVTRTKQLQIAFLAPAFDSPVYNAWRLALTRIVAQRKGMVRPIGYVGWSDPTITDTLDGAFDGVFMVPPLLPNLPTVLLDRLSGQKHRLVTLFDDYTALGIPCVDMASPLFLHKLAEHLASLGHRRVGCINTQPVSPNIQKRMEAWQAAAADHGFVGEVIHEPVEPFEHPGEKAYAVAARLMDHGQFNCSAYFCVITEVARGVMRAAYERGIRIGRDVSLCSCDELQQAKLMTPSLTTLDNPDREGVLERGLQWILTGGKGWDKPLQIHPDDIPVWAGESTGPAPEACASG